jgi:hypothetical protein
MDSHSQPSKKEEECFDDHAPSLATRALSSDLLIKSLRLRIEILEHELDEYKNGEKSANCSLKEKWTKSSKGERADLIMHLTRLYLSPSRDPHEINEDTAFIIGMINSAVRRENDNLKARYEHFQKQLYLFAYCCL